MPVLKKTSSSLYQLGLICVIAIIGFSSCDEQQQNFFVPTDYSTVPAPYDTVLSSDILDLGNGLRVHILERGTGIDTVTMNDRIELLYTGRFTDGEIFDSSFSDGRSRPAALAVTGFISGFGFGVVGSRVGERRTIIIPPAYGYFDFSTIARNTGRLLRGEVLIFDVELVSILK